MTRYAVKCMISTASQSGAKLVENGKGEAMTFGQQHFAGQLKQKMEWERPITGITQQFMIVDVDNPGWLSKHAYVPMTFRKPR